jgi:hypothetical protein
MTFPLFATLAITKSFKAGRKTFKANTAAWVQGTHKTMPKTIPEGYVMIGKTTDSHGNGIVVSEAVLVDYATIEL